eukprot:m.121703 g.121703  ORF g.121703 m.121703 type:complete len:257 (-) comp14403_c0_seq7:691-1461(-)
MSGKEQPVSNAHNKRESDTKVDGSNRRKRKKPLLQEEQVEIVERRGLRFVTPYFFEFTTHAKKRWLGVSIIDVFAKEFHAETKEYYEKAILSGRLTVNGKNVKPSYIMRDNDFICNTMHRHEPPVTSREIEVVFENDKLIVVDKPGSIPVHPTGRYRHNTIVGILGYQRGLHQLHPCHRLDRLTSGLLILAKNQQMAKKIDADISNRMVSKEYICKVRGKFPTFSVHIIYIEIIFVFLFLEAQQCVRNQSKWLATS